MCVVFQRSALILIFHRLQCILPKWQNFIKITRFLTKEGFNFNSPLPIHTHVGVFTFCILCKNMDPGRRMVTVGGLA